MAVQGTVETGGSEPPGRAGVAVDVGLGEAVGEADVPGVGEAGCTDGVAVGAVPVMDRNPAGRRPMATATITTAASAVANRVVRPRNPHRLVRRSIASSMRRPSPRGATTGSIAR